MVNKFLQEIIQCEKSAQKLIIAAEEERKKIIEECKQKKADLIKLARREAELEVAPTLDKFRTQISEDAENLRNTTAKEITRLKDLANKNMKKAIDFIFDKYTYR